MIIHGPWLGVVNVNPYAPFALAKRLLNMQACKLVLYAEHGLLFE